MEITCPRCRSLHEIEPPASVRARGPRSLKFRCSHCGHTFTVDPGGAEEATSTPSLAGASGEAVGRVRVDGKEFAVPDLAAVQRMIVEHKLTRDALLSNHGMRWVRAGDRDDLAVFFAAADALTFRERNLRTEMPQALDDEIVVDMEEAEERPPAGVPVAIGPHLDAFERNDLDTMIVDFGMGHDDTVEQTVRSGGVDETPIPEVPAGFGRIEPEATEQRRPAPVVVPDARPPPPPLVGIPAPASLQTVTPAAAQFGSAAFGPAPDVGPRVPPTLVPTSPKLTDSQAFFFDAGPVASPPSQAERDVFDEPSAISTGPRIGWLPVIGLGLVVLALLVVILVLLPPSTDPVAEVVTPEQPAAPPAAGAPVQAPGATGEPEAPPAPAAAPEVPGAAPVIPAPAEVEAPKPKTPPLERRVEPPKITKMDPVVAEKIQPIKQAPKQTTSGGSARALVTSGWSAVEAEDFKKAHGLFDRALAMGASANAYYGRAYTNEKLGDVVSAADDYCSALTTGSMDVSTSREIEAGLRRIGRSCP